MVSRRSRSPFEQRNPGAGDVAHVDAERHQIAPCHAFAAGRGVLARQLDQCDEVEPHAFQPQFEIDVVDGRQRAADGAAGLVDGAVVEEGHGGQGSGIGDQGSGIRDRIYAAQRHRD